MTADSSALPAHGLPAEASLLGHRRFRAMNTNIELFVRDADEVHVFAVAEEIFHSLEARLSRFRWESELCDMNRRSGQEVRVSTVLFDVLRQAQEFHRLTHGIFEPAVLGELEAAGYDRSFEKVDHSGTTRPAPPAGPTYSISDMVMDSERALVIAPPGLRIDLGGIGKGYAVDVAARAMQPARNYVVNAGGDLFASGAGPDGDGWLVNVTKPGGGTDGVSLVRLYDQALATSTTAVRRWHRGDRLLHHLIDPRTGQPAESGVLSVSVVAETAVKADVFAKVALLLGPADGPRFLSEHGANGLFLLDDGRMLCTPGWSGSLPATPGENGGLRWHE